MSPEEFITEKAHRFGDRELARIEQAHHRAMRWLKDNLGKKPPAHIKRALDESRVLAELEAAQRDKEAMAEYQKMSGQNPEALPPIPKAGQVAIPRTRTVPMLAALDAKRRRDG